MSEQQFINTLQPPSAGGNTAQDALLALLDQVTQSNATAPVGSVSSGTTASINTGTTPQDALAALVQNFDPATATDTGNSAQDAIAALLNPSDGSSNGTATTFNSTNFAHALSLYQNQLEQQLLAGISASQTASIATV